MFTFSTISFLSKISFVSNYCHFLQNMACFRRINCLIHHSHLTLQKIVLVRKQIRIVAKIIFSTLRFLFFKLQIANVRQNVGKTFIYLSRSNQIISSNVILT